MKIRAQIVGDLRRVLAAEVRAGERAAMATMQAETKAVQEELRQQVRAAFGAKASGVAGAWRTRVFPSGRTSLRPAGLVWTKVPNIVDAFERGATIRPIGGSKFLTIPTGFNRVGGRRGGKPRVTPAQMVASKKAFLRPFKSGRGFLWCLPVQANAGAASRSARRGLLAGGITTVATGKDRGRLRRKEVLAQGFVPMFLLLRQVKLGKKFDLLGVALKSSKRLPGRFVSTWATMAGSKS